MTPSHTVSPVRASVQVPVRDASTRTVTTRDAALALDLQPTDVVQAIGGSVVVRDGAGGLLLLIEAPLVRRGSAAPVRGQWRVDGDHLRATSPDGQALDGTQTLRIDSLVGRQLVSSVSQDSWLGKPRWTITPTKLGRDAPLSLLESDGWAQARQLGGIPESASLKNQFVCHPASLVARSKATWNIEAARDASSLSATMAAGCNPVP